MSSRTFQTLDNETRDIYVAVHSQIYEEREVHTFSALVINHWKVNNTAHTLASRKRLF